MFAKPTLRSRDCGGMNCLDVISERLNIIDPGGEMDAHDQQADDILASERYETLRLRHLDASRNAIGIAFERLRWPEHALREARRERLRALIAHARQHSPWHARRLAGVDPQQVSEETLGALPTMSKDDLMSNFDEIVTDRALSLTLVNAHLRALSRGSVYLLDRYRAVATSGTSGQRGVFIYDWDGWLEAYAVVQRYALAYAAAAGMTPAHTNGFVIAHVAAALPTHMTHALTETFKTPQFRFHQFPVTMPLTRIVAGLDEAQPVVLQGYPSMLRLLAHEARAQRLHITPRLVISTGEPLDAQTREVLQRTFAGASIENWWGTSETSGLAMSCGAGPWMHLSDDTLIVELVDAADNPIEPGETAARIYVTNLFNRVTPLIRYELSDQPTLMAGTCPCGSAHRRVADLQGRHEELFVYRSDAGRSIVVHPKVFTSVLFGEPGVLDYQIAQTHQGADVAFLQGAPVDCDAVARALRDAFAALGLPDAQITVRPCDALRRAQGGKLARHLSLPGRCAPQSDAAHCPIP